MVPQDARLVAIVDDDESIRSALLGLMKVVGVPAQAFGSAEEFLESGVQRRTGCLIADVRMPGMSGLELQAALRTADCSFPIIFITAHGNKHMRARALKAGAIEFFAKPFDQEALVARVQAVLKR